jgi:lipoprotein-releasing system ATP-binding protein
MLRLEGLRHTYPHTAQAVLDVGDWVLDSDARVLLRGVSGSGKTTLLNIAAGLLRPSAGEVYYDGQPIYALTEANRDKLRTRWVGYVFQNHHLLPSLTALENVIMPLAFAGVAPAARRKRALELLGRVGLLHVAHHYPARMSTGQRLRAAVARALANAPRLLLADEPTAALDADSAAVVMDVLLAECAANGAALLVASHDPALEGYFVQMIDLRGGQLNLNHEGTKDTKKHEGQILQKEIETVGG